MTAEGACHPRRCQKFALVPVDRLDVSSPTLSFWLGRILVIVDTAGDNRRFHRDSAGLRKGLNPCIQLTPCRADLALTAHTTSRVLNAIADRLNLGEG